MLPCKAVQLTDSNIVDVIKWASTFSYTVSRLKQADVGDWVVIPERGECCYIVPPERFDYVFFRKDSGNLSRTRRIEMSSEYEVRECFDKRIQFAVRLSQTNKRNVLKWVGEMGRDVPDGILILPDRPEFRTRKAHYGNWIVRTGDDTSKKFSVYISRAFSQRYTFRENDTNECE
jgi:hypothetical protein